MRAKATKVFNGRPDDEPLTRRFRPGDVVTGELAQVAVREGFAEAIPDEPEAAPAPSPKRKSKPRATRSER